MKCTKLIFASFVVFCCILAAGCVQTPEEPAVTTTDYANPDNWMIQTDNPTQAVDLFFLYPTAAMNATQEDGMADIDDAMKAGAMKMYELMGTVFADYTNVYAPYYRQVSFEKAAQYTTPESCLDCMRHSEAKEDVFAAIDYYFKNFNNGRPVILAGHSQGASMTLYILEEYMEEHPEYYKLMVAAYPLGTSVTDEWLNENPHLKFATGETDTGVIITYNLEGPNANGNNAAISPANKNINPLNWKTDETYAEKSLNKGSLVVNDDGTTQIIPGLHDAQIDTNRTALITTTAANYISGAMTSFVGDKSLHGSEFQNYYANLAENGQKRIDAYLAKNK